jgi:hypothetical protein
VATNEKLIDAPVETVFEVLVDPVSCVECVVGADEVSLLEYDPDCRVVVEVHRGPLSVARVDLEVIPENGGTRVRMVESPTGELLKPMNNGLFEMFTYVRNGRGLDRLADAVE